MKDTLNLQSLGTKPAKELDHGKQTKSKAGK
jgi:hypothetical protein